MKATLGAYAVLGIAIVVACGTNGGGGSGLPGPAPANGSGDIPPPGFDTPPGQDPPPGDYDDPSDPVPPPSVGGSCPSVCQALIGMGCTDLGENVRSCTAECELGINQIDCGPQLLAFLACIIRTPEFTCDVLTGEVQPGQFTECQTQALDYAQCADGGGEGGRGGI